MELRDKALQSLKKYFGYEEFRKGQLNIILSILNKKDVFCVMPTGAGKSLCYQIPALILDGVTLVISPLISLMKDQVDNLIDMGINSAYINSSISNDDIDYILNNALKGEYKLIYIAPERLESKSFTMFLKKLKISQVAVDEAHCVSEWGHDFRKSYRYIKPFVSSLNERPIVSAFTGTATLEVREDTIKLLNLSSPYVFLGDINRENLYINVFKEEDKLEKIKEIIREHEDESGIIYCLSRKEVESLYYYLREMGFQDIAMYHAGLRDEDKIRFQEDFLYERTNIIIATNAFGMGIDKSNIRYIVHCTMPKNLECYYQEIGRGGRDGLRCDCYLFYNRQDISRVEFLINKSSTLNRREITLRKLQAMIEYCETTECYRKKLLNYFDNKYNIQYCRSCSNCLKNDEVRDYTKESQMILSTVYRTREKFGISVLSDILKGIKGPKIIANNLMNVSTFSIMKDYQTTFIKDLIKELLKIKYVNLKEGTYSMLQLNEASYEILYGKRKVFLILKGEEEISDKELFMILKNWRRKRAYEEQIKPYIIFSDSTIIEIVNRKPKNIDELMVIRGVGEKKINKYGKDIINLIDEYNKRSIS